ncbi:MAG: hypothetical protein Q3963_03855, partial [Coriobacteriaceae bacterium]|nr:hypothetical protein [Coriobacteriaceae bacterium]
MGKAQAVEADIENDIACSYIPGSNGDKQHYNTCASTIGSYLLPTADGYMRVQGGVSEYGIVVVYYDNEFNALRRKVVAQDLELFGGFAEHDGNYYVVTGQSNPAEDDSTQVFCITKYDSNWKRLGSCGLYGANTTYPFDAGSCRMDFSGSYLVVRTCHEMYKSSDGLNHQANVTILVNADSMTDIDSVTDVSGTRWGYVSHSFNQFVKIDGDTIVTVDHGDAYPRSICLMKFPRSVTGGVLFQSYYDRTTTYEVMGFPGEIGDNRTGASVGGFEISRDNYLVAGNSVVQDSNNLTRKTRNVFVMAVDKTSGAVSENWLTDDAEGGDGGSTPQLVKVSDDRFLVLWSPYGGEVRYAFVDGSGIKRSEEYKLEGRISDCVPIVKDGAVVWYSWLNGEETFYRIPLDSPGDATVSQKNYGHQYEWMGTEDGVATFTCSTCEDTETGYVPTGFTSYWRNGSSDSSWYSTAMPDLRLGESLRYLMDSFTFASDEGPFYSDMTVETD